MSGGARAKWIDVEPGCALEILTNAEGPAQFVVQQRYRDGRGRDAWSTVYTSGLYADAAAAEADGRGQWKALRKAWFGAMTVNERLVLGGVIEDWDAAVRARDRRRMAAILAKLEVGDQAARIIEAVLGR
jgi:hypothetical protein